MQTPDITFTDTHCHLYASEFDNDLDQVISDAKAFGIKNIMMPNIDLQSIQRMLDLAGRFHDVCYPMIGLHPTSVKQDFETTLSIIFDELQKGNYIAIGETGVDLYWDTSTREIQIESFETQIEWAKTYKLPVIIHSRESLDLNIGLIEKHHNENLKGIFHCFGGTLEQAMRIYDLGFKVGIGGVVTFKNSGLTNVLPALPPEMIVLETDAPYLAPVPHRGKRNEPAYIRLIAERIAEVLSISIREVSDITNRNAEAVFGKKG